MRIGRRALIAGVMTSGLPFATLSLHAQDEEVQLQPSDPDPHGAAIHNGYLYLCDAGIGSPSSKGSDPGEVFRFRL